jgi:hypothetical protein
MLHFNEQAAARIHKAAVVRNYNTQPRLCTSFCLARSAVLPAEADC